MQSEHRHQLIGNPEIIFAWCATPGRFLVFGR